MLLKPNQRAKRYILRVTRAGQVVVTVPRRGTPEAALVFADKNMPWIRQQLASLAARPAVDRSWRVGMRILYEGELRLIRTVAEGGGHRIWLGETPLGMCGSPEGDLRSKIEAGLWWLSEPILHNRALELCREHGCLIRRITVRNQRSRWGSCSARGTLSLNWRLIQAPSFVRDYITLHELAHTRHMNHSSRFWAEVHRMCPDYTKAEAWLKANAGLLR